MTEKTLAQQKYENWSLMIIAAASELPRWYNPRTKRSELIPESTKRLRDMIDDTKHMIQPMCEEWTVEAFKKHGIDIK